MRFTITAPDLTQPTYQTLEEYSKKRFAKVEKFLRKTDETDHEIRISVEKTGDIFNVVVEVFTPVHVVTKCKDRDMRKCIDKAADTLIRQLREGHDKHVENKIRRRVVDKLRRVRERFR